LLRRTWARTRTGASGLIRRPVPALASLKWPGRPDLASGNMAWTYMVEIPARNESFAIFIGEVGAPAIPFEVWVKRGPSSRAALGRDRQDAVDGHALGRPGLAEDENWTRWPSRATSRAFRFRSRPRANRSGSAAWLAAFARIVHQRCDELGTFPRDRQASDPLCWMPCFRARSPRPVRSAR